MQTRTYSDLYSLIQALCGVAFSSIEAPRIKALVNRRAVRAYRASPYWTRFLVVGEERLLDGRIIPFEETGKSVIDSFLHVHADNPYIAGTVQEYDYHVGSKGATLVSGASIPTSAWVTYQSALPYKYGDGAGEEAAIPREWFEYLAHGTYADYLRAEGQQEKAALADQEALEILTDEMLVPQNVSTSNVVATKIRTNMNSQTRNVIGGSTVGDSSAVAPDLDQIFESGLS